jgi:PAS domain S-box-containing protein
MARIAIVEDESVAAWYLQEALENMGHEVVDSVASGEEAMQLVSETQPELVLMDIRLQGEMDGIATAEQIRRDFNIPVVYLTAHADDATLSRAIATNPFGYLVKPFQEREVHTTIEIALRRHELEQRTENTKSALANTLKSMGNATIVVDRDGKITSLDPMAQMLTGWSPPEVLGQPIATAIALLQEDSRQLIENPLVQVIQDGISLKLPPGCLLRSKDGTERPVNGAAAAIGNSDGKIVGGVLVFQDDSLQRQALSTVREQLSETQERNRSLELTQVNLIARLQERTVQLQQALASTQILKRVIDQIDSGATHIQILQTLVQEWGRILEAGYCWVALYDADSTLATVTCEYVTFDEAECYPSALGRQINMQDFPNFYRPLLRKTCWLSPPPELLPESYQLSLTPQSQILICPLVEEQQVIGEVGILRSDKSSWSQLQAELISQVISQCAVILRQAQSYQTVRDRVADLKLFSELKDNFIDAISQEMYTPLTNMRMAVDMLSSLVNSLQKDEIETTTPLNREQLWKNLEQYLQVLREEWQREFDLVSDLLNLQSLETLNQSYPLSPIDLQHWLPQLVKSFSRKSIGQGQLLNCYVVPDTSSIISHQPSLQRILTELLTNACKFSPPNSLIEVTAEGFGESIVIKVTNTGVTIAPEEFDRIFQPFYRIARPNLWDYSSTGLGLALVKKLAHLLGGEIQVHSEAEETTFTLTLFQPPHLWESEES